MTDAKPKQVALYARVSTKDKGQDVENQLVQLREYAGRRGFEIVDEYMDYGTGVQVHPFSASSVVNASGVAFQMAGAP